MTSKKHDTLAFRLGDILVKLNTGERIDIHALAQEYQVHIRTYNATSMNASPC